MTTLRPRLAGANERYRILAPVARRPIQTASEYFEDSADARRIVEKIETRCLKAARYPQSPSARGNGSTIPDGRFLRSRRPHAGQVRDASPRQSGKAVGQPMRFSIR